MSIKEKLTRSILTQVFKWAHGYRLANPRAWTKCDTNALNSLYLILKDVNSVPYKNKKKV